MSTGHKSDDKFSFEDVKGAFDIVQQNSYLKLLSGNDQLFYVFVQGMIFQKTGVKPTCLLDDEDFMNKTGKYKEK